MSSDSDSELFFDAEENTPIHGSKKRANSEPNVSLIHEKDESKKPELQPPPTTNQEDTFIAPKPLQGGRRKFKELRQKLQNDDEDLQTTNLTPPNSQTSSIEGVYASSNKTSHPFKVIEVDTLSLQSFSSGRRLIGQTDLNSQLILENRKAASASALSVSSHSSSTHSSKDTSKYPSTITLATITAEANNQESLRCLPLQEPDVIASTKPCLQRNNGVDVNNSPKIDIPVAPPRRKKKIKPATSSLPITDFQPSTSTNVFTYPELVSPATTIETLTRELEHSLHCLPIGKSDKLPNSSDSSKCSTIKSVHSLDIRQVTKGQFVVKPQDNDKAKAETSPIKELSVEPEKVDNNSPRGSTNRNSVGHYSLGPHRSAHPQRTSKERRKSAGDENMFKFPDVNYRNLVNSDKPLTDLEILQQVTVLNLDTGERIPLSVAEDKLPQCLNPLSLHIMRLTSEYVSSSSMEKDKESDDESIIGKKTELPLCDENDAEIGGGMRRRTAKLKRFLGSTVKRTMHKAKSIAQEVSHARDRHREDIGEVVDEMHLGDQNIKLKAANSHKGPYDFEKVHHVQELNNEHEGPIWCMKFSACGRLLATAGQDKVLRIWVIIDAFQFFQDMRTKYNAEKVSPTPSQESLVSHHSAESPYLNFDMNSEEASKYVFMPKPFCTYYGHTSDLLDVSWSKNYFILSSSMDKTVRLWHISRKECLCCFQHIDFVTAIVFHPRDDRYFLSGSLDGKIRLWNIPDKKVAVWNEIEGTTKLITAANFCQNGKFAVIGSYDGRCIFYNTDQLKYHTQIHVRSTRGRNSTGRKISGIEPMPGEDKILVTSNDSRIRLYDLRDLSLSCKYKGYVNVSSQIKASFSHDGKYIVSGSENRDIYIWKTNHDYSKFTSVRRDRNVFWEAIKAHNVTVTCAIFAPNPDNIIKMVEDKTAGQDQTEHEEKEEDPMVEQRVKGCGGYVLISADFNGCIKIFMNKMKPKHSSLPASALV